MEREIRERYDDIDVELVEGEIGAFDITVDGVLIFSKQKEPCCEGRFPRKGEISAVIRRML